MTPAVLVAILPLLPTQAPVEVDLEKAARAMKTSDWQTLVKISRADLSNARSSGRVHHGIPVREILLRLRMDTLGEDDLRRLVQGLKPASITSGSVAYHIANVHDRGDIARRRWETAAFERLSFAAPERDPHFEAVRNVRLCFMLRETPHVLEAPAETRNHLSAIYALRASDAFREACLPSRSDDMFLEFAASYVGRATVDDPRRRQLTNRLRVLAQKGTHEYQRQRAADTLKLYESPSEATP